jgi:hypothetical protein
MNLYLLTQDKLDGYDTYDSAVVCAKSETAARTIHPSGYEGDNVWKWDSWPTPEDVVVKLIGTAVRGSEAGVICASFNAG